MDRDLLNRGNEHLSGMEKSRAQNPGMKPRILAVDDEPAILELYREILGQSNGSEGELTKPESRPYSNGGVAIAGLELQLAKQGDEAVEMVQRAVVDGNPFAVAFLDVHMPPGPDGILTAQRIRDLDPNVEILIVTGLSDIQPKDVSTLVPPPNKLFYIQKPFHPKEIQQFSVALGAKWRAERLLEESNLELERKVRERTADLEKANERLAKLAVTDELTGLYNRRHLLEVLEYEYYRAQRYGNALTVLMIDLDHFKKVNDRFGHHCGDEVLKGVAEILQVNTRRSDLTARFGGEEFTVLLMETGLENAARAAENLRKVIEANEFSYEGRPIRITASIGVATYPEGSTTPDKLLQMADDALYQAKKGGRNRVEIGGGSHRRK